MKSTLKNKITIPKNWTGDEAKIVWEFLENIIVAIWNVHFNALDEAIKRENALLERTPGGDDIHRRITDDDYPF